jgi:hypothetical protein
VTNQKTKSLNQAAHSLMPAGASAMPSRSSVAGSGIPYKRHVASDNETDLTKAEREAIKKTIELAGEPLVLEMLSIGRQTLARVVAGLPVRRGTVALVRQGMKANPKDFPMEARS